MEGLIKGDIVKGDCTELKGVVEGPVTRIGMSGVYIDVGGDDELKEAFIYWEDFKGLNGKPVKFKIWTTIEVQCEEEQFYCDVDGYTRSLALCDTYAEACDKIDSF